MRPTEPQKSQFQESYLVLGRKLLAGNPGFDQCPPGVLDALLRDAEIRRAEPGAALMHRGVPVDSLMLVLEGSAEVRLTIANGRRHLLAFLTPGMLIGFIALVDGGPSVHDVVVHAPSVLLCVPAAAVRALRQREPALVQAFELQLAVRSRRLYDVLAESMMFPLRLRLKRQLVDLAERVGVPREGCWRIELALPQEDLADLLGASRQSVNAELGALQREGAIRVARSQVEVLALEAMRSEVQRELASPGPVGV